MSDHAFPVVAYQIDVARRLERMETLSECVETLSDCGYTACMLYLEDAYQYPRHPRIGRRHAYSPSQMKALQEQCARHGQELIPVIPALGHAAYITSKEGYATYDEGRGSDKLTSTVSPSFPETYELLGELFADWCEHVPGRYLHVGLDESPAMGQWAERQGETVEHAALFAEHCNQLNALVKGLGRRMIMWGDMFYYFPAAIELVDRDIIVADWYYYPFPVTPRIEAFNFSDVDLTGELIKRGFEVWGAPSTWPNMPFPNVEERWANVSDWCRYGKERGMQGLLITDWENSTGFCGNIALVMRAFGLALSGGGDVEAELRRSLAEMTGLPEAAELAEELIELGRHHLTGRDDRVIFFSPLETQIIAERQSLCREHWEATRDLLPSLLDLEGKTKLPEGKHLLASLRLSHRLTVLAWQLGWSMPAFMERLRAVAHGQVDNQLAKDFQALADEMESFSRQYAMYWNEVRFADDAGSTVAWAEGVAMKLRGWGALLEDLQPAPEHPLYVQSRLICHLKCRHPALPVLMQTIRWKDGHEQRSGLAMIRFAGPFAQPDKEWEEFRCMVLERNELPEEITLTSNNYGEVGVADVIVERGDQRHHYYAAESAGEYVAREGGVVWLGPIGAAQTDPTTRPTQDWARFRLQGSQ